MPTDPAADPTADPTAVLPWPTVAPVAGGVRLRAFTVGDVAMVRELATDDYLPQITSLPAGADESQALAWIERQHGRPGQGRGLSFCAAALDTDVALGSVGLWTSAGVAAAVTSGRATVGYAVAPSARGRHVARDAIRAVLGHAWTLPWLHRVEAYIEADNHASRRSAELAGFAPEGQLRSHQPIGGSRRDMMLYACLRPEGPGGASGPARPARGGVSEPRGKMTA